MQQKELQSIFIFFTFILFPSHFALFLFLFLSSSFFLTFLFFQSYFFHFSFFFSFAPQNYLQHNTYIAFVRDDVMTRPHA
jgi:hypothetical protein